MTARAYNHKHEAGRMTRERRAGAARRIDRGRPALRRALDDCATRLAVRSPRLSSLSDIHGSPAGVVAPRRGTRQLGRPHPAAPCHSQRARKSHGVPLRRRGGRTRGQLAHRAAPRPAEDCSAGGGDSLEPDGGDGAPQPRGRGGASAADGPDARPDARPYASPMRASRAAMPEGASASRRSKAPFWRARPGAGAAGASWSGMPSER